MKSWKTTLGGCLAAAGTSLAGAAEFDWLKPEHKYLCRLIGFFLGIAGIFAIGLFARDNDKSSEQVGAGANGQEKASSVPITRLLLALGLCFGLAATVPGCVTGPDGKSVPNVPLMKATAKEASYVGTVVWLKAHPEDRAEFELTRTSLRALIAAGSFSTTDLTQALSALPIGELRGDTGAIIVGAAVTLWDAYGRELASLDQDKVFETYVLPVAQSILEGLDAGLAPPRPAQ